MIFACASATNPGVNPRNETCPPTGPTVTDELDLAVAKGDRGEAAPVAGEFNTGPWPTRYTVITLPAVAGFDELFRLPSRLKAMA